MRAFRGHGHARARARAEQVAALLSAGPRDADDIRVLLRPRPTAREVRAALDILRKEGRAKDLRRGDREAGLYTLVSEGTGR